MDADALRDFGFLALFLTGSLIWLPLFSTSVFAVTR
jgi:hypothetical protein